MVVKRRRRDRVGALQLEMQAEVTARIILLRLGVGSLRVERALNQVQAVGEGLVMAILTAMITKMAMVNCLQ